MALVALGRPIAGTAASIAALTRGADRPLLPDGVPAGEHGGRRGRQRRARRRRTPGAQVVRPRRGSSPTSPNRPAPARRASRLRKVASGEVRVERPFEQVNVLLGVNGLGAHDERRYALGVLNAAVGGGPSSRLFQEVREHRGLAYSVYSFAQHYTDAGAFCVGAGCLPGQARRRPRRWSARSCAIVARDGITEEELARGKGQLRGGLVLGLEDSASRMSRIAKAELLYDELPSIEEIIRRVDAVTLDDVHTLARTCSGSRRRWPSSDRALEPLLQPRRERSRVREVPGSSRCRRRRRHRHAAPFPSPTRAAVRRRCRRRTRPRRRWCRPRPRRRTAARSAGPGPGRTRSLHDDRG